MMNSGNDDQLDRAFASLDVIGVAKYFSIELRLGVQKSPFRVDKKGKSFSVFRDQKGVSRYKDHADESVAGGVWHMCALAGGFDLETEKKKIRDTLITINGEEPENAKPGTVKRIAAEKRQESYSKAKALVAELPRLGTEEPGPMCERIRSRWEEGTRHIATENPRTGKRFLDDLAETRGWESSAMLALVELNKTGLPSLPWEKDAGNKRGWGWLVEKPIFKQGRAALVPVGCHIRYKRFGTNEAGEKTVSKSWVFVPYIPQAPKSEFQQFLAARKTKIPPYPFVLGNLENPRLVVILEGQFDAVSFALAFQWLENGLPPGVVVFGLRGVSSPNIFLAAYGNWLRKHKPFVWIFPDNDEAGKGLVRRKNAGRIDVEPCFIDRVRAQGCKVKCQFLPLEGCKDFNDIWRAQKPSLDQMQSLAAFAGCGELI